MKSGKHQNGFTLLELMISMAISLFLVLGMMHLYSASRSAFRGQEHAGQLMENGRIGIEILSRAIRLARYWGCSGTEDASVTNHLASGQQGIFGINGTTDEITVYQVEDDTEIFLLDIDDALNAATNPDPLSSTAKIHVAPNSGFVSGDYIVINNCTQADVIQLSGVTTASGEDLLEFTACTSCTQSYETNASIFRVRRTRFFIATGARGEPALFQQENGGTPIELIEGVEDMQIYYGEDTNNDDTVDRYVQANVIDDVCLQDSNADCWRGIAVVRISLLLRTMENGFTNTARTYRFDGASRTATDYRLRREFLTIISLRNHRA